MHCAQTVALAGAQRVADGAVVPATESHDPSCLLRRARPLARDVVRRAKMCLQPRVGLETLSLDVRLTRCVAVTERQNVSSLDEIAPQTCGGTRRGIVGWIEHDGQAVLRRKAEECRLAEIRLHPAAAELPRFQQHREHVLDELAIETRHCFPDSRPTTKPRGGGR
jgi:hypothetical protein